MRAPDLSRLIAYYRRYAEGVGRGEEFDRMLATLGPTLQEVSGAGRDAGFLLHVAVCLRWRREEPAASGEALRRLTPAQRASLLRGLRILRILGAEWLRQVWGPAAERSADQMAGDIEVVYQRLTRPVVAGAPFFALGAYPGPMTPRQRGPLLDAAIVSVLEALRGHPKAAAVATVVLEQAGAVRGAPGGVARVKKRGQRAQRAASDPFTLTASLVTRLRGTYTAVTELVNPADAMPDRSPP